MKEIVDNMPDWFPKLARGERVFGTRKDKLVLDILDSGRADDC